MKERKRKKLINRFPHFFPGRKIYYAGKENIIDFAFEHSGGWFDLIWDLCLSIENELTEDELKDFRVMQCKEKFGGLCFYTTSPPEHCINEVCRLIDIAENKSYKICEECGSKGESRKDLGWIKTLCLYHYKKEKILRRVLGRHWHFTLRTWANKLKRFFKNIQGIVRWEQKK